MKFSEAMLKGYKKVNGRQAFGQSREFDCARREVAYCALGAAEAVGYNAVGACTPFFVAWGMDPMDLNDADHIPWEHIYGMAVAAGL